MLQFGEYRADVCLVQLSKDGSTASRPQERFESLCEPEIVLVETIASRAVFRSCRCYPMRWQDGDRLCNFWLFILFPGRSMKA